MTDLRNKTQEITDYLRGPEVGVKVIELFQCQWEDQKRDNPEIDAFIERKQLNLKSAFHGKRNITKEDILQKVRSGEFFGLIQCNIHVPERLREKFSDLPPIFKNTTISRDDIGPHMKEHCIANHLLTQPRRSLISSYHAQGILLATPLLKWYLEHGLVVTDVQ